MTRGRVIAVAYYFPPLAGIASDRAAALTAMLPDRGWETTVITADNGFYHRSDHQWAGPGTVVRTPSIELSRLLRSTYSSLSTRRNGSEPVSNPQAPLVRPLELDGRASRARDWLREFVYVPDAQVGWIPFASRAALHAVTRGEGPCVLWTTSVPYSSHLAGLRVARAAGVPWVAEFRDPWTTAHPLSRPRSRLRRRVDAQLEARILGRAAHVIVTSQAMRRALIDERSVPPERVSVITNGFTEGPPADPPRPSAPMTILYAGAVVEGEDPEVLMAALDRVHEAQPGSFRLVVLGPRAPWDLGPTPGGGRPWLELRGVVSPARAREEMRRSSVLLLLQYHESREAILPGKSFEYVGARRPVLALVRPEWELADLLRKYADARFVRWADRDALAGAVAGLLAEHRAGTLQHPRVSAEVIAPLARTTQAAELAQIFNLVSDTASAGGGR
jgi:glycosyltransferase involved in cell wall biosynthesis